MWLKYYSSNEEAGRVDSRQIASLTSGSFTGTASGPWYIKAVTASGGTFIVSTDDYATSADAISAIDTLLASENWN